MRAAYVVPVAVGGDTGRFGENRSSKRAQGVVAALGAAMALCLLIGTHSQNVIAVEHPWTKYGH